LKKIEKKFLGPGALFRHLLLFSLQNQRRVETFSEQGFGDIRYVKGLFVQGF